MKKLMKILLLLLVNPSSSFLNRVGQQNCDSFLLSTKTETRVGETEEKANTNKQEDCSLYLFSLPSPSQASSSHGSVLIKRLWEWKDQVLGDGRDFFVPRPKTIAALNHILCEQLKAREVVVLSNCARFDVVLVMDNQDSEEESRTGLARTLLQQYEFFQGRRKKKELDLSSMLWLDSDQPDRLLSRDCSQKIVVDEFDLKSLSLDLQCLEGAHNVALYMCRVAAGLQAQGRRPDRPVIFRPFNSRDAHVMLQLKRTADIAGAGSGDSTSPRIKALLDQALQSGKAARDPAIVPAILPLKKYGSGGSSGRYSLGEAPPQLILEAAMQAESIAIQPMVAKYVEKWNAASNSGRIQSFWQAVEEAVRQYHGLALSTAEAKPVRAMMHPYVMEIREGKEVDMDLIIHEIRTFATSSLRSPSS